MLDIWKGVQSLLDSYAQIDKKDFVAILYTSDALESAAWISAALEQRGISHCRFWMMPLQDQGFESRLIDALPAPNILEHRLVIISLEKDTMSHTTSMLQVMRRYPSENVVALRGISVGPEFFSVALIPTPQELESRNTYLLEQISKEESLRIETAGGSNFSVKLEPKRYRWISNRGCIKSGGAIILPAGEVATYPASIDGDFVADFAYNINTITERDVRLTKEPVHLSFEHGYLVDFQCENQDTMDYLRRALSSECSRRVGELGFGTNFAVKQAIPMNSHVNERCPGVHIGLGQHNQDHSVLEYQCSVHLDLIACGGLIWKGDKCIVDLSDLPSSSNPHPSFTTDEDVFSPETDDCCGSFQCDLVLH
jgi:Thermophilic metalloprotease (M29)